ncbi:lupus La protein homolog [Diadema setosum]|uniref:lupus La protein homolog n=1 Tax=Diadema setosum TaxID=31175 RepID=UPI003B3AA422
MAETGSQCQGDDVLAKKISRQIEYYFGDSNLKRDRFLQLKIREDNGWVPLEVMIKFNRLKALTEDFSVIIAALEKSPTGLMEISEDKLKIRRAPSKPLPEETANYWKSIRARSVYCKGFAVDESLDTIQDFMDQFGTCIHIQMRRDKERKFKGSIFAVYESQEAAEKFISAEDVKLNGTEMIKMAKDDYFKKKTEERKVKRDDEKKKKLEEKEQKEKDQVEAMQSEFDDYEKGCVIHFSGVNDQTSREDLKELFGDHGDIQWVDFTRGQTEGTIRFSGETKAQEVLDKAKAANEGVLKIRDCELTLRVLEGEEEEEHWKKVFEDKSRARIKKMQGRRGKKQKGFNRRERGGGDRGNRRNQPQNKKIKFDSDDEGDGDDAPNGNTEGQSQGTKRSAEDDGAKEPAEKKGRVEETTTKKEEEEA